MEGIFLLKKLKYVSVGNLKKLTSLRGIEALQSLESLEIQKCKGISSIDSVFKLHKLKQFLLLDSGRFYHILLLPNTFCRYKIHIVCEYVQTCYLHFRGSESVYATGLSS